MRIKEILVQHHTHLDVGYTHSQPILWEMHREYLDLALDFLDETADWPELSRPKWTCEVTAPVTKWLETASDADIARFTKFVKQGRIGISAMEYNTTPLCNAEQLARQLYPIQCLRKRFGATINTLSQHDVNGIPWPMVDLMIDSGIELLTMSINETFGKAVKPRPGIFRWAGPSGREILVMNGNVYTMFDQIFYSWENSIDRMEEGFAEYLPYLAKQDYPHDFLYLTTTQAPKMWDNSPPNLMVAKLIRQWNERGCNPPIRYATPGDLLARIRQIPAEMIPVQRGDWTDWWNFGCASTAYETRINKRTKPVLFAAELLQAERGQGALTPAIRSLVRRAWNGLNLYDEHTWGYHTTDPLLPPMRAQSTFKLHCAYEASELAEYLLTNELEALAGNPPQSEALEDILLVNPASTPQTYYVRIPVPSYHDAFPPNMRKEYVQLRSLQFMWEGSRHNLGNAPLHGPVTLEPYSWKRVPRASLPPAVNDPRIEAGETFIESPFHRLTFDPKEARVFSLLDKARSWEVLAPDRGFSFFQFVRERTAPHHNGDRNAIFNNNLVLRELKIHGDCWQPDWKADYTGPTKLISCRVERGPASATLVMELEAPGVEGLIQRITLHADKPLIDLDVEYKKLEDSAPEGIYFAIPLNLPADWKCHFDTAGVPVELDVEQLPGASRDWVTVESFASIHAGDRGVTLYCPDAPLIQAGGFNFGRVQTAIPRSASPLLLAWPMNNYWHTNFPKVQPGHVRFHYALGTHGAFDVVRAMTEARGVASPVIQHPAFAGPGNREGRLIEVAGDGILIDHVKLAEDGNGVIVRLVNVRDCEERGILSFGNRKISGAFTCSAQEESLAPLSLKENRVEILLPPRQLTAIRLVC